jgi:hypothetical protein
MTTDSIIKYGIGIDETTELVQLGIELGFITRSGAWYKLTYLLEAMPDVYKEENTAKPDKKPKIEDNLPNLQGEANLVAWLTEHQAEYEALDKVIGDMFQ